MRKLLCFAAVLVLAVSMEGVGQYYKVLYTAGDGVRIINGYSFYTNLPSVPSNYNPFDLENDGKTEIVVLVYDSINSFAILDGATFAKKYDIKRKFNYNGTSISLDNYHFYGFYDIDGDNEREAIIAASDTSGYGIAFVNIKTQTIEYFIEAIPTNMTPIIGDINNDGFLELITPIVIISHSVTPVAQAQPLPLSKKSSLSINTYPNPATSLARIEYNVPIPSIVNIAVYNAAGRLVRQLMQGRKPAGNFTEIWNGKSDDGEVLVPGEYYYDVKVGNMAAIKKIVLLK